MPIVSEKAYQAKKKAIINDFSQTSAGEAVALKKPTTNLFRPRNQGSVKRLDVKLLNGVIKIDTKNLTADVEGMATYETVVNECLKVGVMPLVVPQLKSITVGGGVSGLAIESSSFKYGLTHESVKEMEVLTGEGKVVTCSPTQNADLFYGLPNSYGTLGYILRLKIAVKKVKPYIYLKHLRFNDNKSFFNMLKQVCESGVYKGQAVQFVDGAIFEPTELYLTLGFEVDKAPYNSDYTYKNIFYRSIRHKTEDYLTIHDYIWRWDTDWFWCSKNVGAENPIFRRILGKKRLQSKTYSKMMNFENRHHWLEKLTKLLGQYKPREAIIQDVQLPIDTVSKFLDFFHKEIGIKPVWICPTRAAGNDWPWTLYPMDPGQLYINVGFWDAVPAEDKPEGYFNRKIEAQVLQNNGTKGLYSSSYYTRHQFESLYNYRDYLKLKKNYDPKQRFKDLYEKCVKNG